METEHLPLFWLIGLNAPTNNYSQSSFLLNHSPSPTRKPRKPKSTHTCLVPLFVITHALETYVGGRTFGGVYMPCIYSHARWTYRRRFRSLLLCPLSVQRYYFPLSVGASFLQFYAYFWVACVTSNCFEGSTWSQNCPFLCPVFKVWKTKTECWWISDRVENRGYPSQP